MEPFETLVARFVFCQMQDVVEAGKEIGLAPVSTLATALQVSASGLVQASSPAATVALLRAYADVIEAGPGSGPTQTTARSSFETAAQAMTNMVRAGADFPAPKGRA